jgi:hypothetical protein
MLTIIGIAVGIIVSLLGSFIIGLIPFVPPFHMMFMATVIPSIFVFIFIAFSVKPTATNFKNWFDGFTALFIISFLGFAIKNYFEAKAVAGTQGVVLIGMGSFYLIFYIH